MNHIFSKSLFALEILGVIVLILVLLALTELNIPMLAHNNNDIIVVSYMLALLVAVSIPMAILHLVLRPQKLHPYRFWFGVVLLLFGGAVFYFFPQYFYQFISADIPFWFKVSIYSLPAICVEGGLFTLFTDFMEKERRVTKREYSLLSIAFLLYATGSVATNFMVILGDLAIGHQLFFARMIVTVVTVIGGAVIITHSTRKQA